MAVNPVLKQQKKRGRGRPFAKGRSGNPAGRPAGARGRATLLAEQLLDGEVEGLVRKAVAMALRGDAAALRLCLERIIAPRREPSVRLDLPPVTSAADLGPAMAAVAGAAAAGAITPAEAWELSQMLDTYMRSVTAGDFERRLKELEAAGMARRR